MSFLYLIGLFVVWLIFCVLGYFFWRDLSRSSLEHRKLVLSVTGLLLVTILLIVPFWYVWGKTMYYDAWVRWQCAKDGGVKVYETVPVTQDLLGKYGQIQLSEKPHSKDTDRYFYQTDNHYYRESNPRVVRRQTKIIRRSDNKVLGEYTRYSRSGGGLSGPWHGSSYRCPTNVKFETSVFVKGGKE